MGRLTLHVLLSFATFEREIIGERTRDKISAARKKGKWMGGCPVLGYDPDPHGTRLVVNEAEAERVREIFAAFMHRGELIPTLEEIEERGWRLKSWTTRKGQVHVGGAFDRAALARLLKNVIYTGQLARHTGERCDACGNQNRQMGSVRPVEEGAQVLESGTRTGRRVEFKRIRPRRAKT